MSFNLNTITFSLLGFTLSGIFAVLAHLVLICGTALLGFVGSRLLKNKLFPFALKKASENNQTIVCIFLEGFVKPVSIATWVAGLLLAALVLTWSFSAFASAAFALFLLLCLRILLLLTLCAGLWYSSPIAQTLFQGTSSKFEFAQSKTVTMVIVKAYKVLVVAFFAIALMNEFNFDATSLIAGLGLVGLTISLAAQDSASNLFSGLLILIEHPFGIGDWISVSGVDGTVEDISFRSTKIRALDNSLYVLPNSSVSSATINNGTNRQKRMYRFTLGVTYDTTRPQLEALMHDMEEMLKAHENVDADSALVRLSGFGDSSIDLLVSCYVTTVEMPVFLSVQNELHLNIMDVMEKNGASFAFPSTTVYLEGGEKKQ